MKSFIAALRSLVLPFNATTGARIILDGVNGRIEVYDNTNTLVGLVDSTGIWQYNANGSSTRLGSGNATNPHPTPQLIFNPPPYTVSPPTPAELHEGAIYVWNDEVNDIEVMSIEGPHFNTGSGAASNLLPQIQLISPDYAGTRNSEIKLSVSDFSGNIRITADGFLDVTQDVDILGTATIHTDMVVDGNAYVGPSARDIGRGYYACDRRTTVSGAVGAAETVAWTLANRTYKAGRAYEVRGFLHFTCNTANAWAFPRIRKTNAAGQLLAEYGRQPAPAAGTTYIHPTNPQIFAVGAADVTANLVITMQTSLGTVTLFGDATAGGSGCKLDFFDVGAAADYIADDPNIAVLV